MWRFFVGVVLVGALVEVGLRMTEVPTAPHLRWEQISIPEADRPLSAAYVGEMWAAAFVQEQAHEPGLRYEPFSLWTHEPYQSRDVTFQANGYRKTLYQDGETRIYLFGGEYDGG